MTEKLPCLDDCLSNFALKEMVRLRVLKAMVIESVYLDNLLLKRHGIVD